MPCSFYFNNFSFHLIFLASKFSKLQISLFFLMLNVARLAETLGMKASFSFTLTRQNFISSCGCKIKMCVPNETVKHFTVWASCLFAVVEHSLYLHQGNHQKKGNHFQPEVSTVQTASNECIYLFIKCYNVVHVSIAKCDDLMRKPRE